MKLALFAAIIATGLVLTACTGDEEAETPKEKEVAPAPSETMAPEEMETSEFASGVIDHSQDEKEFELRKSLYGVESLIEHYEKEGYDTAELEEQKAQLEAELDALLE